METWRAIVNFPNYMVSDEGHVRSIKRRRLKALVKNKRGYVQVNLYRHGRVKNFLVHRLVAQAFLGDIPRGWEVNHIDGNKINNHLPNLELVSAAQNRHHARMVGLVKPMRGEKNLNAKLTEDQVRSMRSLREQRVPVVELARRFEVTPRAVYAILSRKTWSHLD
jgi:hypothetical protein